AFTEGTTSGVVGAGADLIPGRFQGHLATIGLGAKDAAAGQANGRMPGIVGDQRRAPRKFDLQKKSRKKQQKKENYIKEKKTKND
uniref:Uncharacterized protein n=1 Tax=Romanomermis culicivorax TaxID=13658 RepID=A0A915J3L6_ROMCU